MNTTVTSPAALTTSYDKAKATTKAVQATMPQRMPSESDAEYSERVSQYTAQTAAMAIPRR